MYSGGNKQTPHATYAARQAPRVERLLLVVVLESRLGLEHRSHNLVLLLELRYLRGFGVKLLPELARIEFVPSRIFIDARLEVQKLPREVLVGFIFLLVEVLPRLLRIYVKRLHFVRFGVRVTQALDQVVLPQAPRNDQLVHSAGFL